MMHINHKYQILHSDQIDDRNIFTTSTTLLSRPHFCDTNADARAICLR